MMRSVLALAILALGARGPQDDLSRKIDEVLPRLSDDSIEERDRAVRSLVELGAPALPLLRKKASQLGGESQGRLLEACSQIEARDTLARFLPPFRSVSLDWENRPARDAFEEIARRSGLVVDTSNASVDLAVTFSLKNATPLQAIDEVCRRAGVTWRSGEHDFMNVRRRLPAVKAPPHLTIQNGKAVEFPSSYLRQYRVRVTQISLTRTNNFQANQSNAQLNFDLSWAPGVKPDGLRSFKITDIKDDQGRSLLLEENDRLRARFRGMHGRWRGRDMGSYSQFVPFKFPEGDARSIGVLKGTAVFSFPQELKTITFEKPSEAQGKSVEVSGLTVTLKDFQSKGAGVAVSLEMTGKFQGADEVEDDGFGSLPFSYEDVEVLTEAGDELRHQGMSGGGDGKTYTWQIDYEGAKASSVKEIRISCVLRHFNDEASFEIRDIALPK